MSKKDECEEEPLKVILLGNGAVGKTSIITAFYDESFSEHNISTLASSYIIKKIEVDNKKIILNVWDTAGQEKFNSISKLFLKNSKIIILVYDVTKKDSFKGVNYWYDFITNNLSDFVIGLAGNKTDLLEKEDYEEEVSADEAREWAKDHETDFELLSAKCDPKGIYIFFHRLVEQYIKKFPLEKGKNIQISPNKKKNDVKKKCC